MTNIAVWGASGVIGSEVAHLAVESGWSVLKLSRRPVSDAGIGSRQLALTDPQQISQLLEGVDLVIDASPAGSSDSLVQSILWSGLPVIGIGDACYPGTGRHLWSAGALPGILTAAPTLLPNTGGNIEVRCLLQGPISVNAARDMLIGARRDQAIFVERDIWWPTVGRQVDLVAFKDEDTAFVEKMIGRPVSWWSVWAGKRLRAALRGAAALDIDQAASVIAAASLSGSHPPEITVWASQSGESVSVLVGSVARCCAATAVYCANQVIADPQVLRDRSAVTYLGDRLPEAMAEIIAWAGGQIVRSGQVHEEGEL